MMAYCDYIHCAQCTERYENPGRKLIYDGYDHIRDNMLERFGDGYELLCPACVASLRAEVKRLTDELEHARAILKEAVEEYDTSPGMEYTVKERSLIERMRAELAREEE